MSVVAPQVGRIYLNGCGNKLHCVADLVKSGVPSRFGRSIVMVSRDGTLNAYCPSGHFIAADMPDGMNDLVSEYVAPPEPRWVPFTVEDAAQIYGRPFYFTCNGPRDTTIAAGMDEDGITYCYWQSEDDCGTDSVTFADFLETARWLADSTPCGKQVPQ